MQRKSKSGQKNIRDWSSSFRTFICKMENTQSHYNRYSQGQYSSHQNPYQHQHQHHGLQQREVHHIRFYLIVQFSDRRLYFRGSFTRSHLEILLQQFGRIDNSFAGIANELFFVVENVIRSSGGNYGFIRFVNPADAEKAFKSLQGYRLNGVPLLVKFAFKYNSFLHFPELLETNYETDKKPAQYNHIFRLLYSQQRLQNGLPLTIY